MNLEKMIKKCVVFLLLGALLISPVFLSDIEARADENNIVSAQGKLYMDYLGLVGSAGNGSYGPQEVSEGNLPAKPGFTQADTNVTKVFWIGVRIKDLDAVQFIKDGGIRDMEIGIKYNKKYVKPCDDLSLPSANTNVDSWVKILQDYNLGKNTDEQTDRVRYVWNSDTYTLDGEYSNPAAQSYVGEVENDDTESWDMLFVNIMKIDRTSKKETNRFFDDYSNTDGYYILRVPFQLVGTPVDENAKADAFSMAFAPGTFVMTNGEKGAAGTYAWESSTVTDNAYNLGNYFSYGGDLNIFTYTEPEEPEVDELTSLKVSYDKTEEETVVTKDVVLNQYKESEDAVETTGFEQGVLKYYVSVPAEVAELTVTMGDALGTKPVVERYDYGVDTSTAAVDTADVVAGTVDGKYVAKVTLKGEGGGDCQDVIRITLNGSVEGATPTVYYIYVARQANEPVVGEPYIKLYPGNSPYGLIERMGKDYYVDENGDPKEGYWDEAKIAEAKAKFDEDYCYVDEYVPDNGEIELKYWSEAWGYSGFGITMTEVPCDTDLKEWAEEHPTETPYVNHDKNSTAEFVYLYSSFVDVGVEIYDSTGKKVQPTVDNPIVRTIEFENMAAGGNTEFLNPTTSVKLVDNLVGADGENGVNLSSYHAKPGIYTIRYEYEDSMGVKAEPVERVLVILPRLGDVNMDATITTPDANVILKNAFVREDVLGTDAAARLCTFRVNDVNNDLTVTTPDANAILKTTYSKNGFYASLTED